MTRRLAALALVALLGCDQTPGSAPPAARLRLVTTSTSEAPWRHPSAAVLAIVGEARLVARALPQPEGTHGQPLFGELAVERGAARTPIQVGIIIDAVLSSDDAVAFVMPEGRLVLWRDGSTREIDRDVTSGLSFSADGRRLAYAKGTAPELDVMVADLDSAQPGPGQPLAADPAADYLPAFAPDGRLLFTSTRDGAPALWIASGAGVQRIGVRDPARAVSDAPDGRVPPSFAHGVIVFFDGRGVRMVDEAGRAVGHVPGGRRWLWRGDRLLIDTPRGSVTARLEVTR